MTFPILRDRVWLKEQLERFNDREIAGMINCSYDTVYRWRHRHGLPPHNRGRPRVLTDAKLKETFRFIVEYRETLDGLSPSIREIQDAMGFSSTSVTGDALKLLEDRDKIVRENGKARCIHVPGGRWVYEGERHAI